MTVTTPVQHCRACSAAGPQIFLTQEVKTRGRLKWPPVALVCLLLLSPTIVGALLLWLLWPRTKETTDVLTTCRYCGVRQ